jgi:outer membrane murein-binding lipoprotein Lpp
VFDFLFVVLTVFYCYSFQMAFINIFSYLPLTLLCICGIFILKLQREIGLSKEINLQSKRLLEDISTKNQDRLEYESRNRRLATSNVANCSAVVSQLLAQVTTLQGQLTQLQNQVNVQQSHLSAAEIQLAVTQHQLSIINSTTEIKGTSVSAYSPSAFVTARNVLTPLLPNPLTITIPRDGVYLVVYSGRAWSIDSTDAWWKASLYHNRCSCRFSDAFGAAFTQSSTPAGASATNSWIGNLIAGDVLELKLLIQNPNPSFQSAVHIPVSDPNGQPTIQAVLLRSHKDPSCSCMFN